MSWTFYLFFSITYNRFMLYTQINRASLFAQIMLSFYFWSFVLGIFCEINSLQFFQLSQLLTWHYTLLTWHNTSVVWSADTTLRCLVSWSDTSVVWSADMTLSGWSPDTTHQWFGQLTRHISGLVRWHDTSVVGYLTRHFGG